jgi:hypothetical protein
MPRGDRTGPAGMGPMTGRAAGFCAGNNTPGFMNPYGRRGLGFGRGFGRGMGMGMGWRWAETGWHQPYQAPAYTPSREDEIRMLEEEARYASETMESINARLAELKKGGDKK